MTSSMDFILYWLLGALFSREDWQLLQCPDHVTVLMDPVPHWGPCWAILSGKGLHLHLISCHFPPRAFINLLLNPIFSIWWQSSRIRPIFYFGNLLKFTAPNVYSSRRRSRREFDTIICTNVPFFGCLFSIFKDKQCCVILQQAVA